MQYDDFFEEIGLLELLIEKDPQNYHDLLIRQSAYMPKMKSMKDIYELKNKTTLMDSKDFKVRRSKFQWTGDVGPYKSTGDSEICPKTGQDGQEY